MLFGDSVLDVIRSAQSDVLIVAPYIKTKALERLMSNMSPTLDSFTCVTRWLPADIATGVCDLEILDLIEKYSSGKLLVHPHLHAKYYRADQRCLVGSANITNRGLGWATPSNIELIVELSAGFTNLDIWEKSLVGSAVVATQELREQIDHEAERLITEDVSYKTLKAEESIGDEVPSSQWVPMCPIPEQLWNVYIGQGQDEMVTSAWKAAQMDLKALQVPNGLSKNLFKAYISSIFKEMPVIQEIQLLASKGLTDAQAQDFLKTKFRESTQSEIDKMWNVLKAWFTCFLGHDYRIEPVEMALVKGRNI